MGGLPPKQNFNRALKQRNDLAGVVAQIKELDWNKN